MGLATTTIDKFLGVNYRNAPESLAQGEMMDSINVQCTDRQNLRGIQTRYGLETWYTYSGGGIPDNAIYSMGYWRSIGQFIISWGNILIALKMQSGSAAVKTNLFTGSANPNVQFWTIAGPVLDSALNEFFVALPVYSQAADPPKKISSALAVSNWANSPPGSTITGTTPPRPIMAVWKGRLLIAQVENRPNRLFFSDRFNFESPAAKYGNNFIDFVDDSGGKPSAGGSDPVSGGITALIVHNDFLYVFKRNSFYRVYDSNTFANTLIGRPGCSFPYAVCSHTPNGRLYWLSEITGGLHSSDGVNPPVLESHALGLPDENPIGWGGANMLNYIYNAHVVSAPLENAVYVSYAGPQYPGSGDNDRLMEFIPRADTGKGVWFPHEMKTAKLFVMPSQTHTVASSLSRDQVLATTAQGSSGYLKLLRWMKDPDLARDDGADAGFTPFRHGFVVPVRQLDLPPEKKERLRRVNVVGQARGHTNQITFSVTSLNDENVVKVAAGTGILVPTANFSQAYDAPSTPGMVIQGGIEPLWPLVRFRPESRGRFHYIRLYSTGVNQSGMKIKKIEAVFRGGKEH